MMKHSRVLLGLVLILFFDSALACPAEKKDCTMDKKTWTSSMSSFIPAAFCKADSPFIKCYEVNQTQCLDISLTVTQRCMADNEKIMPKVFNKADSIKWGEIIGTCAGDKLTDIIKLRAGKDASCGL